MVKASSLHMTIIIALIISVILGSMIYLHWFFGSEQLKLERWDRMSEEVQYAMDLSTSSHYPVPSIDSMVTSPYSAEPNLKITKDYWGLFEMVNILSVKGTDSLAKSFLLGLKPQDSTVLYLMDEERPVSISGQSLVKGTAYLPKSGIRPNFVDGEYFKGDPKLITGQIKESDAELPKFATKHLDVILNLFESRKTQELTDLPEENVLRNSFRQARKLYSLKANNILSQDSIIGNIIIIADSTVRIPSKTVWENAIIIAPTIIIEEASTLKGQFFATDSLSIEKNSKLEYPSVLAIVNTKKDKPSKLLIGRNCNIEGITLLYKKEMGELLDYLELARGVILTGDVISSGGLKYMDKLQISGSLYCRRIITQRPSSLYENYLIDVQIDRSTLHSYFLRSFLFSHEKKVKPQILSWLD